MAFLCRLDLNLNFFYVLVHLTLLYVHIRRYYVPVGLFIVYRSVYMHGLNSYIYLFFFRYLIVCDWSRESSKLLF